MAYMIAEVGKKGGALLALANGPVGGEVRVFVEKDGRLRIHTIEKVGGKKERLWLSQEATPNGDGTFKDVLYHARIPAGHASETHLNRVRLLYRPKTPLLMALVEKYGLA